MTLEQTIEEIRARSIFLPYSERGLGIWAPGHSLPAALRQAIKKHQAYLLALVLMGDTRLCPAVQLHRPSWKYVGAGQFICPTCKKLDASMSRQSQGAGA